MENRDGGKNKSSGATKLVTKVNENYVLNIYTCCTYYGIYK